jgi:hypothetical protein
MLSMDLEELGVESQVQGVIKRNEKPFLELSKLRDWENLQLGCAPLLTYPGYEWDCEEGMTGGWCRAR